MSRFRRNLLLAGIGGLLASVSLAATSAWAVTSGNLNPPLPYSLVAWLLVAILGAFSLAEIPVMVFAMRRLTDESTSNLRFAVGVNALYVFFAAVYGAPVSLLTGSIGWGLALSALSVVRLVTSLLFVRESMP